MNRSSLRHLVGGFALVAAMVGVPATAASAAHTSYYCDWDSGYGCASYGYSGYPTDHGRDYGHDDYYRHGRHHRY